MFQPKLFPVKKPINQTQKCQPKQIKIQVITNFTFSTLKRLLKLEFHHFNNKKVPSIKNNFPKNEAKKVWKVYLLSALFHI